MKHCFACFVIGLATAAWASAQDPMELVRHAYQLQQSGDYAGAAEAYREFLKLRPDEVGAHSNLGVVLSKLGRYDEAIVEYEAAQKLAPSDGRIALNLALAYDKSGRISEAKGRLEQLHATFPQETQVTMLLADCYLRLGENGHVVDLLRPLEAQDSQNLAVTYMLGTALIRDNRIEEGQPLVDRILRSGDSAEARLLLGSQIFEAGDYPRAVKQFASAIELNPNLPEVQAYYGQSLLRTGDPDGATDAFKKELVNNPNNFAANLGLAQIYVERKQLTEAAPYAAKAAQLRPESADALLALGEYQLSVNHSADARKTLESAERLAPQSALVHRDLANVYGRLNLKADEKRERAKADAIGAAASTHDTGPKLKSPAPDFTLPQLHSETSLNLQKFRSGRPVVIVFGSYTCPNFRTAVPALNQISAKYAKKVPFLLVYIREAHGSGSDWQSTRNEREKVNLPDAGSMGEKQQHATLCTRKLNLTFPTVVDGLDGKVEAAYSAWPSRAFVIGSDGRIVYSTRLTELDFHATDMDSAIGKTLSGAAR